MVLAAVLGASTALAQGEAKRGEYLAKAGGCFGCHTQEEKPGAAKPAPYAGGRALKTHFGTFFGPNITPHPQAGLGRWSEADFLRAMREGRRPDGAHYYPAFPYPSFTLIADADLRDLWAYLRSVAPSSRPSEPHDLGFFFRWRFLVGIWKWLFFTAGPFVPDPKQSAALNRGRYLATALGHCGECHTPRNFLGGARKSRLFAGERQVAAGKRAPNLTPTRLKKWSNEELKDFLAAGLTPDGDLAGGSMAEVVRNTTGQLTPQDLDALVAYLRSLPPLPDEGK